MMDGPTYDEGHLFVAAIRIIRHRENRPPSVKEIAEFLGYSTEIGFLVARGLEKKGVLSLVSNPFDTHVDLNDHTALEELSRSEEGPDFDAELTEFHKKKEKEQEDLNSFFAAGGESEEKKNKMSSLDEEFRKYWKNRSGDD